MKALLQQALDALEESVDLVKNHCQEYVDLYSKYPTRAARIDGRIAGVKAHEDAIEALRAELAKEEPKPVAWRIWSSKWQEWEYSATPFVADAVPLFTKEQL